MRNWKNNLNKKSADLTDEEIIRAKIASESYNHVNNRKQVGDYVYLPQESGAGHAVYKHKNKNQYILGYKGTSDIKDLVPDLSIAAGVQEKDQGFRDAQDIYSKLKDEHKGDWETVGHSLGGTKAMWVAQNNNIKSHAFNPGYVFLTDDQINTDYDKHNVYLVKGDPISNSIMSKQLQNLKVLPSASRIDPLQNHAVENFVKKD